MKNSVLFGLLIGVLSGLWLFSMHWAGYDIVDSKVSPYEYVSVLIPVIVLYFGVKNFRDGELKGGMGFLEALIQSIKILLVGGILASFAGIVYINYINAGNNFAAFSGRLFGALLVGVIAAFAVSLLLTTKSNRVD